MMTLPCQPGHSPATTSSMPFSSSHRLAEADFIVGDQHVDIVYIAYLGKATPAELTAVSQHDGLLCRLHHLAVERRFSKVRCCDAIVEVDAVDTEEEFAQRQVLQQALTILADYRQTVRTHHAAQLNDLDIIS